MGGGDSLALELVFEFEFCSAEDFVREEDKAEGSWALDVDSRREVRAARNERCRFHMSMKFENIAVKAERSSRGSGVSSDAMMGARKCYQHRHQSTRSKYTKR